MKEKGCKAACLALCLLLCAGIFAGCGEQRSESSTTPIPTEVLQQPTEKPAQVKYMKAGETYRILIWSNASENEWLEQEGIQGDVVRQRYNEMKEQYGVTPVYVASPSDWLGEIMNSTYAGAPICDLFHFGGPFALPSFYTHGGERGAIIEAISDYDIDFSDPEYWNQEIQAATTFGGKQYAVAPYGIGFQQIGLNIVTFFNKDLIRKAGYTAQQLYDWSNNGEWTFDKFREVALACTDPDQEIYGTSLGDNVHFVLGMLVAYGADWFVRQDDGVDVFNMTSAKSLEAIDFLARMAREDKSINMVADDNLVRFANGQNAMILSYVDRISYPVLNKQMDSEYGIVMPPKASEAAEYISDLNWYDGYMICKNIANSAGAVEFASLFLKPAYARSSADQKQIMAAECETFGLDEQSIEILKKVGDISHTSNYMVYASCQVGSENVLLACSGHFQDFVNGSLSPDTYYASVESAVNAAVRSVLLMDD